MYPEVSVIIPVYNAEKSVARCIESILAQKDIELELIIVNDGSIDNSEQVINRYNFDSRLYYHKQDNKGVSAARNVGLIHARGEFVVFVDADDYIVEDSLAKRIRMCEGHEMLISNYFLNCDDNYDTSRRLIETEGTVSKDEVLGALVKEGLIGYQGYLWNKVFATKIIKEHNIFFDEFVSYGEDRLFVARYLLKCNDIFVESDNVYCYCIYNDSAMSEFNKITRANKKKVFSEVYGLHELQKIIKNYNKQLFCSFVQYEFDIYIHFYRNSNLSCWLFRIYCRFLAFERYIMMLTFGDEDFTIKTKMILGIRCIIMK